MGYETQVFLVDQGHNDYFNKWYTKETWCHAEDHWNDLPLPNDALVSDGGVIIGMLKLAKIGRIGVEGDLADLFEKNREQQKRDKKWIALEWRWDSPECREEHPVLVDAYNDPYVLHDAKKTLEALDLSIAECAKENWEYRRFTLLRAILVPFIETFPNGAIISKGY